MVLIIISYKAPPPKTIKEKSMEFQGEKIREALLRHIIEMML